MKNKLKVIGALLVFLGGVCKVEAMQSEENSASQEMKETVQPEEDSALQEVEKVRTEGLTSQPKRPNFRDKRINFYDIHPDSKFLRYYQAKTHFWPRIIKQRILSPEEQKIENEMLLDSKLTPESKERRKKHNNRYVPMTQDEEETLKQRNQEHAVIRDQVLAEIEQPANQELSEEDNDKSINAPYVVREYPMNEQELEFQLTQAPYKNWSKKEKDSARISYKRYWKALRAHKNIPINDLRTVGVPGPSVMMADESTSFDKIQFKNFSAASAPNMRDRGNENIRLGSDEFKDKFQKFYKSQLKLREEMYPTEFHKVKNLINTLKEQKLSLNPLISIAHQLIELKNIFGLDNGMCLTSELQPKYYIVVDVTKLGNFDKFNAFCDNVINPQLDLDQVEEAFQLIKKLLKRPNDDRTTVVNAFRNQIITNTYFMTKQQTPPPPLKRFSDRSVQQNGVTSNTKKKLPQKRKFVRSSNKTKKPPIEKPIPRKQLTYDTPISGRYPLYE